MSRYTTEPKRGAQMDNWWERTLQPLPHPIVHVAEPSKTGLLDAKGHDIYKLPDQIGFVRT